MKKNPYSDIERLAQRTAYLIAGYIRNTLTEAEHDELDDWVNESNANMRIFEDLTDERNIAANLERMGQIDTDAAYTRLQEQGAFKLPSKKTGSGKWWAIAASVIILSGVYLWLSEKGKSGSSKTDLANSGNRIEQGQKNSGSVSLQLSNGTVVNLSASSPGLIDLGQNEQIRKSSDSTLEYLNEGTGKLQTLSTPYGKQFQVKLSDGTQVWLNTASSLTYPGRFPNSERAVSVSGEAYFEVSPDSKRPFKVYMEDSSLVTVLGTHFNVSAYQNQPVKTVTLLEGSVEVSAHSSSPSGGDREGAGARLNPGNQAILNNGTIKKQTGVDIDEVMGWKNGLFIFNDANIETIMKELQQWYNIEVVFKGKINHQFNAVFPRSERLERILQLLQSNGHVNFKTENNTIYVLQP